MNTEEKIKVFQKHIKIAENELKKTKNSLKQKQLKDQIKDYKKFIKELTPKKSIKRKKTEDLLYSIKFRYTNPYIGSRSAKKEGKEYENLTLKEASEKMLDIYNRIFDEKYAHNWGMAVIQSRGKCDGAIGSGDRKRIDYDSRVYEIEPEY